MKRKDTMTHLSTLHLLTGQLNSFRDDSHLVGVSGTRKNHNNV